MLVTSLYEKLQSIVFTPEVFEEDALWLALGVLHVVDVEFGKVTGHYPSRVLRHGQCHHVALCLLEWVEHRAVALLYRCAKVLAK